MEARYCILAIAISLLFIFIIPSVMHWYPSSTYPRPYFVRSTSSPPTSHPTSHPAVSHPTSRHPTASYHTSHRRASHSANDHRLVLCNTPNGTEDRSVKRKCCRAFIGVSLQDFCGVGIDGTPHVTLDPAMLQKARDLNCSCADIMYCRLGYGTALSSNHYDEAQDMFASVQHNLPNTRLIVYDLGLSDVQKETLSSYCNVEVRSFQFEKYPPHVRNLRLYAWKPLIAKALSEEFEVFMYGDSSVRVLGSPMPYVFPLLQQFPFVSGAIFRKGDLPIVALTSDDMIEYLRMPYTRKEMGRFGHMQAGCYAMWPTTQFRNKFLNNWVDCALHLECIAPPGSHLKGCSFGLEKKTHGTGQYIGCHRYDQSAMAMLLIREYGLNVWGKVVHSEALRMWSVEHYRSHHYSSICQCNVTLETI